MILTIDELFSGKGTMIKGDIYLPALNYTKPFLDKMSQFTSDFKIEVKCADQVTMGNVPDLVINELLIQAKMPNTIDNLNENIFMCYSLTSKKPVAKFYRGYTDEDNNLIINNQLFLSYQQIIPEEPLVHDFKKLLELTSDIEVFTQNLKSKTILLNDNNKDLLLGKLLRLGMTKQLITEYGKVKISRAYLLNAYESLFINRDSKYYINDAEEINHYDVFLACSNIISNADKDLTNRFEKILLINEILKDGN